METPRIKAKTRQQVAEEYGICVKTFNRRLKKAKIQLQSGLIYPCDIRKIYKKFGYPQK